MHDAAWHGAGFAVHRAFLDLNLLPLRGNYLAPTRVQDQRVAPSPRRQQAEFDWWERLFDYTIAQLVEFLAVLAGHGFARLLL